MTKSELIDYCASLPGAVCDSPFAEDFETVAARHSGSRKWFGLIMKRDGAYIINLKCEPMEADLLRSAFSGVVPAYHMNKVHWNTVYIESDVPDNEIKRMVYESFLLTSSVLTPDGRIPPPTLTLCERKV